MYQEAIRATQVTDLHQEIIQTEMGITVTTTSFKDTNKRNASTRSKKIICTVMHKEALIGLKCT
jgi:RNase P protein component